MLARASGELRYCSRSGGIGGSDVTVAQAPYVPLDDSLLRERWFAFFGDTDASANAFDIVLTAYRKPGRYYHTIEHGMEVAEAALRLSGQLDERDAFTVSVAAWAHDAHYVRGESDNEEKSAAVAQQVARTLGGDREQVERVASLVLASSHKGHARGTLEQIMCDADLSVFGKPWSGYTADVLNIRTELDIVDPDEWRSTRLNMIDYFDSRRPLYYLSPSVELWETAAIANRARERAELVQA